MSQAPYPIVPDQFERIYESSSPLAVARINGACYWLEDFEVTLNTHGATSSASVSLPITGNPDFSRSFAKLAGTSVTGEIFVGWPSAISPSGQPSIDGLTRVYYGLVAQYDPHLADDRVTFTLRSLASPLVDTKIQQIVSNVTTVDFIRSMCAQFGLQFEPYLGGAPLRVQEVLGEMYVGGSNFSAAIHGMRIWDLILQCSSFDNVDVWEDQGTVYYAAPAVIPRQTIDLHYGRDLAAHDGFIGSHALMFAKDVQVECRSSRPRISQSSAVRVIGNDDGSVTLTQVTKTTTGMPQWGTPDIVTTTYFPNGTKTTSRITSGGTFSTGPTSQGREPTAQRYYYWPRNKDPAYLNAFAVTQWKKITQHEYTSQIRMPLTRRIGILPLTALFRLSGIPYEEFNDTYYPRKVVLRGGVSGGFMYDIDLINHQPALGGI